MFEIVCICLFVLACVFIYFLENRETVIISIYPKRKAYYNA